LTHATAPHAAESGALKKIGGFWRVLLPFAARKHQTQRQHIGELKKLLEGFSVCRISPRPGQRAGDACCGIDHTQAEMLSAPHTRLRAQASGP